VAHLAGVGMANSGGLVVGSARTKSMTELARQFVPGPKPAGVNVNEIGCFALFGLLCLGVSTATDSPVVALFGGAMLMIAIASPFISKHQAARRHPAWLEKVKMYEHGWICLQCGHSWIIAS
jgi:hypothetical protein